MTLSEWLTLLSAITATIASIATTITASYVLILKTRAELAAKDLAIVSTTTAANTQHLTQLKNAVEDVMHATDGMKDALVEAAGKAGFKAGVKSEQESTKTLLG